jgi:UDP-N-acetylglucosamine 4-epimerase
VFGPLQRTDSEYAAVIPNFCKSFIKNVEPVIFGNGETSRDFTYIDNIVLANKLALFTNNKDSLNQIYNVGCGESISLNQVIAILSRISGKKLNINYKQERKGDVRASRADINKIKTLLGYESIVNFEKGLLETYKYYVENVSDI